MVSHFLTKRVRSHSQCTRRRHAPLRVTDARCKLFAATQAKRSSANHSDRLCKYVARFDYDARFDLDWARMRERAWVNIRTKAHKKARVDARRADGER
jgi:sigma54-dependent transcription regulator